MTAVKQKTVNSWCQQKNDHFSQKKYCDSITFCEILMIIIPESLKSNLESAKVASVSKILVYSSLIRSWLQKFATQTEKKITSAGNDSKKLFETNTIFEFF